MPTMILSNLLIVMVVAAALTDFRSHKIPNIITFPFMIIGILGHVVNEGWGGLGFSVGGIGVGFALLVGFYILGGMAAGDVKLLAAVGAFLGPFDVFLVFLMTALLGGIYAVGMLVQKLGVFGMFSHLWLIVKTLCLTGDVNMAFVGNAQEPIKLRYGLVIALGTVTFQFWYWVGFA